MRELRLIAFLSVTQLGNFATQLHFWVIFIHFFQVKFENRVFTNEKLPNQEKFDILEDHHKVFTLGRDRGAIWTFASVPTVGPEPGHNFILLIRFQTLLALMVQGDSVAL